MPGRVDFGESLVDVSPTCRRRRKVDLQEILPVVHAITNNLLHILEARAALPARLKVRADLASPARRHLAIGVSHQLVILRMRIHRRPAIISSLPAIASAGPSRGVETRRPSTR